MATELSVNRMSQLIYLVRGMRIMLDHDLAGLFEVETKNLKRLVRRNAKRFPTDLMFELTIEEQEDVSSQKSKISQLNEEKSHGGVRYAPFAFTQGGVAMVSCLLTGDWPIEVSIYAMRAFSLGKHIRDENRHDALIHVNEMKQYISELNAKYDKLVNSFDQILAKQPIQAEKRTPLIPEPLMQKKVEKIQRLVAQVYRVSTADLVAKSRNKGVTFPRQVAMFFVRKYTGLGYSEIGGYFRRKDHTTVIHACRKIQELQKQDAFVDRDLKVIEACLSLEEST